MCVTLVRVQNHICHTFPALRFIHGFHLLEDHDCRRRCRNLFAVLVHRHHHRIASSLEVIDVSRREGVGTVARDDRVQSERRRQDHVAAVNRKGYIALQNGVSPWEQYQMHGART